MLYVKEVNGEEAVVVDTDDGICETINVNRLIKIAPKFKGELYGVVDDIVHAISFPSKCKADLLKSYLHGWKNGMHMGMLVRMVAALLAECERGTSIVVDFDGGKGSIYRDKINTWWCRLNIYGNDDEKDVSNETSLGAASMLLACYERPNAEVTVRGKEDGIKSFM